MQKLALIIDESGAKNYSDKQEQYEGEFGIMVGFLIPYEYLEMCKDTSKSIFHEFKNNGKLHITDLEDNEQKKLRDKVYMLFKEYKVGWFYHGTFVQDFFESENKLKLSSNQKSSLHYEVFKGVFFKALDFYRMHCKDIKKIDIEIITDNLDKGIIKLFKKNLQDSIILMTKRTLSKTLHTYNKETNELISCTRTSKLEVREIEGENIQWEDIQFEIITENSNLTFIADILANSTHYYIKQEIIKNKDINLNSKIAVKNHPLKEQVMCCNTFDFK
ncbi:MAG: hypothetical protein K2P52_03020 [Campylobacterales bacterium]|nr:hypothetical protein [Campylobacterales bacterium]